MSAAPPKKPARKPNTVRKAAKSNSSSRFLAILAIVGIVGVAALAFLATRKREGTVVDTKNVPSTAKPYEMGRVDAPVTIVEFADFECPACGNWATITEPDVRKRIVEAGLAKYQFYLFPLQVHRNTWDASLAAACANDQGKFWEMHDALFQGQDAWNTQATGNPRKVIRPYAEQVGLDMAKYDQCMDAETHRPEIQASYNYAVQMNVQSTPTFVIGGKMYPGGMPYDEIKKLVDEATKNAPSATATPAAPATATGAAR